MSAWELPTTVEVAGRSFAIRSDFRAVLDALAALTDPDLTQQEQYVACLQILYPRWKELPDANAALRAAFTFINEGKEDEKQGLHCATGGVLYRAHNLRQRRSSQGYERRRIGGGQRSEEGQGR